MRLRSPAASALLAALLLAVRPARADDDGPSLVTAAFALHLPATYGEDPLPLVREGVARQGGILAIVESPSEVVPMPSLLAQVVDASVYGPDEDLVRLSAGRTLRGADPEALLASPRSLLLTCAAPKSQALLAHRALCTLAAFLAARTRAVLYDVETREYFSPSRWIAWRAEDWKAGIPDVRGHVTVHQYPLEDGVRSVTLGMSKFGLPDLVVTGHSRSNARPVLDLLNLVAQTWIEGGSPAGDGRLSLSIPALRHPLVRGHLGEDLGAGAQPAVAVRLPEAVRDEGDPENRLREVVPDGVGEGDAGVLQDRLLTALFGSREAGITWRGKAEGALAEASERARRRLVEEVKPRFLAGLPPGEILLVKGPFDAQDEGIEWMWVEVAAWDGTRIRGILRNEPALVPGLEVGARVAVEETEVFDYVLRHADGSEEGNETGAMLGAEGR